MIRGLTVLVNVTQDSTPVILESITLDVHCNGHWAIVVDGVHDGAVVHSVAQRVVVPDIVLAIAIVEQVRRTLQELGRERTQVRLHQKAAFLTRSL